MRRFEKSKEMYEKYRKVCPGGTHSSARFYSEIGHPLYFSKAQGSRIWDIDGNEFIDCTMGFGAMILGHNHPRVSAAVKAAIDTGLTGGSDTEIGYEVTKKLADMVPCAESVKLSASGTEAVMHAIHIVRGYTGRDLIMKPEGSYEGWYDCVLLSNHSPKYAQGPLWEPNVYRESAGILKEATEKTIVYPFNNTEIFASLVKKYGDHLAGVLLTPVIYSGGTVLPEPGYLAAVREITDKNDIPLVFDEVITGFRYAPGGAQEFYQVTPELAVFGKAMANGYPLSAAVGKEEIMRVTTPGAEVGWLGTHNANQIALAAASACLDEIKDGRVQAQMKNDAEMLTKRFNEIAEQSKLGHMVTGGGIFTPYFTSKKIVNPRDRTSDKKKFMMYWDALLENDILIRPDPLSWAGLSASHSDKETRKLIAAIETGLERIRGSRT